MSRGEGLGRSGCGATAWAHRSGLTTEIANYQSLGVRKAARLQRIVVAGHLGGVRNLLESHGRCKTFNRMAFDAVANRDVGEPLDDVPLDRFCKGFLRGSGSH